MGLGIICCYDDHTAFEVGEFDVYWTYLFASNDFFEERPWMRELWDDRVSDQDFDRVESLLVVFFALLVFLVESLLTFFRVFFLGLILICCYFFVDCMSADL